MIKRHTIATSYSIVHDCITFSVSDSRYRSVMKVNRQKV